jgi:hypothetical protein
LTAIGLTGDEACGQFWARDLTASGPRGSGGRGEPHRGWHGAAERLWWPDDDEKRRWRSELVGTATRAWRKRIGGSFGVQHTEGETRAPLIGPENAGDKWSENGVDGMAAGMQQTFYIEPKLI